MSRRVASAIAFLLAAFALQRACTIRWGEATTAGGARLEVSVVGVSRLGGGDTGGATGTASPAPLRTDCRWWPVYGDRALCAVRAGGEGAYQRLRRTYPLLQVAMWLSVAGLLLLVLRVPRRPGVHAAVAATVAALSATAMWSLRTGAQHGLEAFAGVTLQFNGGGHHAAAVAVVLSVVGVFLLATDRSLARASA